MKCPCGVLIERPISLFCSKICSDKDYKLRRRYNITFVEWQRQLDSQGGVCAICREESERLAFDHNHVTGNNRKILCNSCNLMLGFARDDIHILASAIQYLNEEQ